jgi:hypothetical protein
MLHGCHLLVLKLLEDNFEWLINDSKVAKA